MLKQNAECSCRPHAAQSLHKGQLVTVSADDIRAWTRTSDDAKSRAKVSLKAYDIAPSLAYDTTVNATSPAVIVEGQGVVIAPVEG